MHKTVEFGELVRLIDERSAAFRAAVESAPGLDRPVPSCPGWTLLDLAQHLGQGDRRWAATVLAGPADGPAAINGEGLPTELEAVLAWSAESTGRLVSALRETGPDRACWTWWDDSESPQTSGAVARHRVQESAVHTYDAQLTAGTPRPLPAEIALDGVDEFLTTCCATTSAWPHKPAELDFHATEGRSWRLSLSAGGARTTRLEGTGDSPADASMLGTAGEIVFVLYDRIPLDALRLDGDPGLFEKLRAWDPSE